jgi:hypothetical protein
MTPDYIVPFCTPGNGIASLSGLSKCTMLVTLFASGNSVAKLAEIDKLAANRLLETLNVSGPCVLALVWPWQGPGGMSVTMFFSSSGFRRHRRAGLDATKRTSYPSNVWVILGRKLECDDSGGLLQIHEKKIWRRAAGISDVPPPSPLSEKRNSRIQDR